MILARILRDFPWGGRIILLDQESLEFGVNGE